MRLAERIVKRTHHPNFHPRLNIERMRREDMLRPPPGADRRRWIHEPIGSIDVWRYRPTSFDPSVPHVVYLHGGAFVQGPLLAHWRWTMEFARAVGCDVSMVRYRRTPEHPFPAALDDVNQVVDTIGRPYVLAGDSAGGGLSIGVAVDRAQRGASAPAGLVLLSPFLNADLDDPDSETIDDHLLAVAGVREAGRMYAVLHPTDDPRLSPIHADPATLPPICLHIGTHDLLWPDCREFVANVRAAGGNIDVLEVEGAIHDFTLLNRLTPEGRLATAHAVSFVTSVVRSRRTSDGRAEHSHGEESQPRPQRSS